MKANVSFCKHNSLRRNIPALIVLALFVLSMKCSIASAQRVGEQSGVKRAADISGVKFTVPTDFRLEQSSNVGFAFIRHEKEDLAVFVGVPNNQQIDDQYLTNLSNGVVSKFLQQEQIFRWKVSRYSEPTISTRQTMAVTTKGFNNGTYVQIDLVAVKVRGQEVVIGSVFKSETENAFYLFDREGREYSFSGWKALFQLIA